MLLEYLRRGPTDAAVRVIGGIIAESSASAKQHKVLDSSPILRERVTPEVRRGGHR